MHLLLERINDNILVLHFVSQNVWFIICDTLLVLCHIMCLTIIDNKCKTFVLHCCPWFDLKWVGYVSKLWSKCLPFRACLWAFLSAFYWRFCLVGLSVYSYPGLEAHVCDGLSGWKKYVTCVKTLLLPLVLMILVLNEWSLRFLNPLPRFFNVCIIINVK